MRILVLSVILSIVPAASPAAAQSRIDNLRNSLVNCVESDFRNHFTDWVRSPAQQPAPLDSRAWVEQSFANCHTEEVAYLTGLASMPAFIEWPNSAMEAAATVARVKAQVKAKLVFPDPKR